MDGFLQGILQSVGRGERGEVGEHHLFETHVVEHRLEYEGAFLQLSSGENDDAHHRQPVIAEQTSEHQDHGDGVADGNGAPGGGGNVEGATEVRSEDASAVEGVGGHEIENRQIKIGPHHAAGQIGGLKKRPVPKIRSAPSRGHGRCCQASEGETHQRSNQGEANVPLP